MSVARRRDVLFDRIDPDALVLVPGPAMRYLVGYAFDREAHGPDRPCLYAATRGGDAALLVPELEADRARDRVDARVIGYDGAVAAARRAFEGVRDDLALESSVAVDARATSLRDLDVAGIDPDDCVDASGHIDALRARKDDDEVAALRRAAGITADALAATLEGIEPGMTEREIHADLRTRVARSEADAYGVGVVTSGPRTAQVYADTTDRAVEPGDLVLIDTGVVSGGYYADLTRTVAVGEPGPEERAMHAAVREAAAAAREAAAPGMAAGELDAVARDAIAERGYGDAFVTTLGHGIGLDAHEPPAIAPGEDRVLESGNAFTIEPGVYVPGVGGVRIEDAVVLTDDGADVLASLPRDLT